MTGSSREWVAQKYQLFQCFSAQPRRWYSQKWRRVSLMAQARAVLRSPSRRAAKRLVVAVGEVLGRVEPQVFRARQALVAGGGQGPVLLLCARCRRP